MPTGEARIMANRANAARSTGPRTEEGKARSRATIAPPTPPPAPSTPLPPPTKASLTGPDPFGLAFSEVPISIGRGR